jgi:DNA-binding NarL/FixJ family response regulator
MMNTEAGTVGHQHRAVDSEPSGRLASGLKRLVIVADNSLIVEAIRVGLRQSGEFNLVGYADIRRAVPSTIAGVNPDVVLVDDVNHSERTLSLIRDLTAENEQLVVIVLSVEMEPDWLEQVFAAGARGAISKATHPVALATLVRETINGHIFHRFAGAARPGHTDVDTISEEMPLTPRELEILRLVAAGSTNGEVARKLWVTEQTVKFHLRNIYRKINVANRTEASHFAHVNGLVSPQPAPVLSVAS